MDVALAIFNIGAGMGVLAAGAALAYLAWRATPLMRETRALTADLRRLTRATDSELRPILNHARELTSNVEVLSEDVAVKLDRLTDLMNSLQHSLETVQITAAPRPKGGRRLEALPARDDPPFWESDPRPVEPLPVESWETREDSSDS
ncbi:MAG: hypothetical protein H0U86_15185 [Chloroflexi bacterium]|nr:hypothetical protein [Chloroflexota bacterium]